MRVRTLILPAMLGAAAAVPYLSSKVPKFVDAVKQTTATWTGGSATGSPAGSNQVSTDLIGPPGTDVSPIVDSKRFRYLADVPIDGTPVDRLEDVIRMDVSTAWVYGHWSRKSTALSDLSLFGIRVPLVTGTGVDDLAGSLTYYFNPNGQVQRISFRGRTGDARKLINLVVAKYGFRRQPPRVAGEQVYQVRWNGKAISELRIRPAPVLWATSPYNSFQVSLELERPGSGRFLEGDRRSLALGFEAEPGTAADRR